MSRLALLAVGIPALANAFAPPLAASRTAGVTGIRTAVCSAPTSGGEDVSSTPTRRAVLLAGALGIPALTLGTKGANAIQYDASDPRSREDYLDEQRNMKEKRYARQVRLITTLDLAVPGHSARLDCAQTPKVFRGMGRSLGFGSIDDEHLLIYCVYLSIC